MCGPVLPFPFQAGRQLSLLKVKKKWLLLASCSFFFVLSVLMTGCFLWQYYLPKLKIGECQASLGRSPSLEVPVGFGPPLLT